MKSGIMYFCTNCNGVFNHYNKLKICPTCVEYVNVVVIDDWLAPYIRKFNQYGYMTKACCIGHYLDSVSNLANSYIMFAKRYEDIENVIRRHNIKLTLDDCEVTCIRYIPETDEERTTLLGQYTFIKEVRKLIKYLKEELLLFKDDELP